MAPPGYTNITIQVPFGTTNHSDPSLLCTPSQWTTVVAFYFGNYVAHAATVLPDPGYRTIDYYYQILLALFFPTSGIWRGLNVIMRWANPSWRAGFWKFFCEQDVLRKALKSGALCMIVKKKEEKKDDDDSDNPPVDPSKLNIVQITRRLITRRPMIGYPIRDDHYFHYSTRRIHGTYKWDKLPKEYALQIVPRHSKVVPHSPNSGQEASENATSKQNTFEEIISSSYNPISIIISIFQTIYGSLTLYKARGDQVSRYGYAAFGLTVAPYVVMSIVNLIGALATPSYDTLYLVRSKAMKELERDQGFVFDRTVGEFESCPDDLVSIRIITDGRLLRVLRTYRILPRQSGDLEATTIITVRTLVRTLVGTLSIVVGIGIPLAIIGIISRFHTGESTKAERVWIMTWFGFGILGVSFQAMFPAASSSSKFSVSLKESDSNDTSVVETIVPLLCAVLFYGIPAIGGLVVVGQMLMSYGDCIRL